MPGIFVVRVSSGLEMIVVAGRSTDSEGSVPAGGTEVLDVDCVGRIGVAIGLLEGVS